MFDLVIIGAGPGGYTAAIRASQLGKKIALIERADVGGVCLNRGCIPTKALVASANLMKTCEGAGIFGVKLDGKPRMDFAAAQERKGLVVQKLRKGVEQLLKGFGVELIRGHARFTSSNVINVEGKSIAAQNTIIATGSKWVELPNLPVDGTSVLSSDDVLSWSELPSSLIIVGGGYIGCEFASLLNHMGVKITIVEAMDHILPALEKQLSKMLAREYKKRGIEVITGTMVEQLRNEGDHVEVTLTDGNFVRAEKLFVAVGRKPSADDLDAAKAGIELGKRGEIEVDHNFETKSKSVYAIGDVNGGVMLAHVASEQAIHCVDTMFDLKPGKLAFVPACIFSEPEIGYVGATSDELTEKGIEFNTGRFLIAALGKALVDGSPEGQVIVHADKEDRLLGVHVIGRGAVDIIAEATLALTQGLTTKQLAETIHAHPTYSEALLEAARDVDGCAIHKIGRR